MDFFTGGRVVMDYGHITYFSQKQWFEDKRVLMDLFLRNNQLLASLYVN